MNIIKNNSKKKGFTLIELLISVFIFSLIIGGIVNALLASISLQRRIIADQKMFSEISFTLEYMSRTLRMARKDRNGECITIGLNHNYELIGTSTIRFLNFDGECQEFLLINNKAIGERIANSANYQALPIDPLPITSGDITVTSMIFDSAGSHWYSHYPSSANNQSRVVIALVVESRVLDPHAEASNIRFQTVVSQRKLNIHY